ncbi:hypothetical protein AAMO2058_000479200 [Amorphochlora amoebiformis]
MVCFGVIKPKLPPEIPDISVTTDPMDPVFDSTCYMPRVQNNFFHVTKDVLEGKDTTNPILWNANGKCIDCKGLKHSQVANKLIYNFTPRWWLSKSCADCSRSLPSWDSRLSSNLGTMAPSEQFQTSTPSTMAPTIELKYVVKITLRMSIEHVTVGFKTNFKKKNSLKVGIPEEEISVKYEPGSVIASVLFWGPRAKERSIRASEISTTEYTTLLGVEVQSIEVRNITPEVPESSLNPDNVNTEKTSDDKQSKKRLTKAHILIFAISGGCITLAFVFVYLWYRASKTRMTTKPKNASYEVTPSVLRRVQGNIDSGKIELQPSVFEPETQRNSIETRRTSISSGMGLISGILRRSSLKNDNETGRTVKRVVIREPESELFPNSPDFTKVSEADKEFDSKASFSTSHSSKAVLFSQKVTSIIPSEDTSRVDIKSGKEACI